MKKDIRDIEVVNNGSGGAAVTVLLMAMGLELSSAIPRGHIRGQENLNAEKAGDGEDIELRKEKGILKDVIVGADVFIGCPQVC